MTVTLIILVSLSVTETTDFSIGEHVSKTGLTSEISCLQHEYPQESCQRDFSFFIDSNLPDKSLWPHTVIPARLRPYNVLIAGQRIRRVRFVQDTDCLRGIVGKLRAQVTASTDT